MIILLSVATGCAVLSLWHYLVNYEQPLLHYNDKSEESKKLLSNIPILALDNKTSRVGTFDIPHIQYKYRYPLLWGNYSLLHDILPSLLTPIRDMFHERLEKNRLCFETKFYEDFDATLEDICLDYFIPTSASMVTKPVLLIFPGITGSSESYYVQSLIRTVKDEYQIVVFNRPGCHSKKNGSLKKAKFFLNSHKRTIERVIDIVHKQYENSKILLVGYSAGGVNITKQLGSKKVKKNKAVIGAITISQPFDMIETLKALEFNAAYNKFLVTFILDVFKNNQATIEKEFPELNDTLVQKCTTVTKIDEHLTKKMHNFTDVNIEFYNKRSTFMKHLQRISGAKILSRVKTTKNDEGESVFYEENESHNHSQEWKAPVFIMMAKDDQIATYDSQKMTEVIHAEHASHLYLIESKKGGHCSFLEQYSAWIPFSTNLHQSFSDKVSQQVLRAIVKENQLFESTQ